jgi:RNA polymerase sigma-70 factor (ECF subfamily)
VNAGSRANETLSKLHPPPPPGGPPTGPDEASGVGDGPPLRVCPPHDWQLVEECLRNADGSWEAFLRRFGGLIGVVVGKTAESRGLKLSAADQQDIVADVFVELLSRDASVLRMFEGRSSLTTYLAVIARRVAIRRLLRSLETGAVSAGDEVAAIADPRDSGDIMADREEIMLLLNELEPEDATLVRLYRLEGLSYGAISQQTGIPLNSIGPRLSRVMKLLRDRGGKREV